MPPSTIVPQAQREEPMVTDASADASQSTQQATQQATQDASQHPQGSIMDAHLWGYLLPCNPQLYRIDFHKLRKEYTIGRNGEPGANDIILPGLKISKLHTHFRIDFFAHCSLFLDQRAQFR